jgi:hypothetical protein
MKMSPTNNEDQDAPSKAVGPLIACCVALLGGCAANQYAGISLLPGRANADIQGLARRASAGDRLAQLELGRRFEQGIGVTRNASQACAIYTATPAHDTGEMWIYTPSSQSVERYVRPPNNQGPADELAFKAYECRVTNGDVAA